MHSALSARQAFWASQGRRQNEGRLGAVSLSDEAALGGQTDPQYNLHVLPRLRPPLSAGWKYY